MVSLADKRKSRIPCRFTLRRILTLGGPVAMRYDLDVTYGDVARSVDLLKSAGFEKIDFGGGRPSQRKKR